MQILIKQGDLLEQDVDVIVNAWNQNFIPYWLLLPHGVSKAIKEKAGTQPFKEVRKHGFMKLGEAVLTSAGNLKYKGIIHVAGIDFLWRSSEKAIRLSVINAMKIVEEMGFKSIAFPLIGSGGKKMDEQKVIDIITEELLKIDLNVKVVIVQYKPTRV